MNDIIGCFMVAFNRDPDHEYSFTVRNDGTILPTHLKDSQSNKTLFYEFLQDPDLHHVLFIQWENKNSS